MGFLKDWFYGMGFRRRGRCGPSSSRGLLASSMIFLAGCYLSHFLQRRYSKPEPALITINCFASRVFLFPNNRLISTILIAYDISPLPSFPYRLGLNGLLNPPTRFIYCLYSVFFSFLTPYTLFPFTLVFFVDLNPVNPIAFRISATSGSESSSTSMASLSCTLEGSLELTAPFVLGGLGVESAVGRGGLAGAVLEERGPVGGARLVLSFETGLRDRAGLIERGGVRVRARLEA